MPCVGVLGTVWLLSVPRIGSLEAGKPAKKLKKRWEGQGPLSTGVGSRALGTL